MARYRTKPKEKVAEQWQPGKTIPGVHYKRGRAFVITIHGQETLIAPGDFIVQEPDGIHYYPCKPDIWLAGHELIEE